MKMKESETLEVAEIVQPGKIIGWLREVVRVFFRIKKLPWKS